MPLPQAIGKHTVRAKIAFHAFSFNTRSRVKVAVQLSNLSLASYNITSN